MIDKEFSMDRNSSKNLSILLVVCWWLLFKPVSIQHLIRKAKREQHGKQQNGLRRGWSMTTPKPKQGSYSRSLCIPVMLVMSSLNTGDVRIEAWWYSQPLSSADLAKPGLLSLGTRAAQCLYVCIE